MQNQFIAITNTNRPSLEQINEHLFQATERYQEMVKQTSRTSLQVDTSRKSTSLAAAVRLGESMDIRNASFKPCSLCVDADHPIYKCKNFRYSS